MDTLVNDVIAAQQELDRLRPEVQMWKQRARVAERALGHEQARNRVRGQADVAIDVGRWRVVFDFRREGQEPIHFDYATDNGTPLMLLGFIESFLKEPTPFTLQVERPEVEA